MGKLWGAAMVSFLLIAVSVAKDDHDQPDGMAMAMAACMEAKGGLQVARTPRPGLHRKTEQVANKASNMRLPADSA